VEALRAELAVELVGGVVLVGGPGRTLRGPRGAGGNRAAGTLPAPSLRESIVGREVPETDALTGRLRSPFHV